YFHVTGVQTCALPISAMIYFTIDKLSTTPLYRQIIDQVVDMVQTRTIKHMDKLPTEKEFSDIYHVSSFVVKRAYSELRQMGLVRSEERRVGKECRYRW